MAIKKMSENIIDVSSASDRELLEYNCVTLARLSGMTDTMARNMALSFKAQDEINLRFESDIDQLKADVDALKGRLPLRAVQ